MKKNITMNLFGTLYAIDEDAYELLNCYLENMKHYFARKEGGEEIADDIEHRMAELLNELHTQGVGAINIDHIKSIIERIGSPEEMDGEESAGVSGHEEETVKERMRSWVNDKFSDSAKKKLFRNPGDQIIGGVLSGIACYLNTNPIWIRLLVVLLAWGSYGSICIVYIVLMIIIPPARTVEEKLQMKGIPVTMENMSEEIMKEQKQETHTTAGREIGSILHRLIRLACALTLCILISPFICVLGLLLVLLISVILSIFTGNVNTITQAFGNRFSGMEMLCSGNHTTIYWITFLSLIFFIALTVYLFIHLILKYIGRIKPMSMSQRTTCIIAWFLSLIVTISSFIHSGVLYETQHQKQWSKESHIQDSVNLCKELDYLKENGWKVNKKQNCKYYISKGEHYTGNHKKLYISSFADNQLKYEVEKTVKVAPGIYRLKAAARANGNGCRVFACSGNRRYSSPVPIHSNEGGSIWADAIEQLERDTLDNNPVLKRIAKAHNNKGYGWNEVTVENIEVKDSVVRYGITNDIPEEEWTGTWFSATDFCLEKMK